MIPAGAKLSLADAQGRMGMAKKGWIKKATANAHGQFAAKAEKAGKSTRRYAQEHAGDSGKTGAQARLAETLMGMSRKAKGGRRYTHASNAKAED